MINPNTLTPNFFTAPPLDSDIIGFSPNGAEIYMPALNSGIRAFNLSTGAANDFFFDLPSGSAAISGIAQRMAVSPRQAFGENFIPVFFTFFSPANGGVAIAFAQRNELVSSPPMRRLIGTQQIGPAQIIGIDLMSEFALTGHLDEIRRQTLTTSNVIAPAGSTLSLPGVWSKSDIVFADEIFRAGFE